MAVNREQRMRLESAILNWGDGSMSVAEFTSLSRAIVEDSETQQKTDPAFDKGTLHIARIFAERTYPVDEGFTMTKHNWKRAHCCLAYLRSELSPPEIRFEEHIFPVRRKVFRIFVSFSLCAILISLFVLGWRGLFAWPICAAPGLLATAVDIWHQSHDGPSTYFPFASAAEWKEHGFLADRPPTFAPTRFHNKFALRSLAKVPLLSLAIFINGTILVIGLVALFAFQGPFALRFWQRETRQISVH